ncbi:MAG: hypothetical protein L6266_04695 [Nanoarchaeota archaeon]|nr:hypothetical protein [Nanoarchaeota archaeon]
MFAAFAALFVLIAFGIFLMALFQAELIQVIINIPILWVILLRSQAHIKKEKKTIPYIIGLVVTTVLFLTLPLAENSLKAYLWWPTLFIIILFILANIIVLMQRLTKSHEKY